ncbi:hypothetical protein E3N88_08193 [Mikania micrantha]|uniref:Uncharacterized protein n=1 Tax=Mikania micrantha TaxID=192012 RepID=A0A5N6PGJ8_9ASTR|nr:hypothetical protein E3N88_08193 [Mikania micrantha]
MAAVAVQVFGTPITQGTRTQRAQAAAKNQNADGKLDQVLQAALHSQKAAVGGVNSGTPTFGLLYNATGDPMTYQTSHDWEGHVDGHYPIIIQNGHWVFFKHVGKGSKGSVGAVVYNIQNCTDSMIAWNNHTNSPNTVYCEMNEPGYYDYCDWTVIHNKLKDSGTTSEACMKGFTTKVSIHPDGDIRCFKAEFNLKV